LIVLVIVFVNLKIRKKKRDDSSKDHLLGDMQDDMIPFKHIKVSKADWLRCQWSNICRRLSGNQSCSESYSIYII